MASIRTTVSKMGVRKTEEKIVNGVKKNEYTR